MTTDTSERGLERLICRGLTGKPCDPPAAPSLPADVDSISGGMGWICGNSHDYNREFCIDLVQLAAFLNKTQPKAGDSLSLNEDNTTRRKFLSRLKSEIDRKGTIHVLRNGIKHHSLELDLFYGTPSADNEKAKALFDDNRFSVTRQLRYSTNDTQHALDIGLFINGLPVATFELKNNLTKQTVSDAVKQYQHDRNPKEILFKFGRCIVHFAVDDKVVYFCTELKGKASVFLPFNKGWNQGAGNSPNPEGVMTDYLWQEVLASESLANIIENYAQAIEEKDTQTNQTRRKHIWPRYHQLDVVRKLLVDAEINGVGKRYLIQHSAGSGKSNSIAWLAHQLIGLENDRQSVFDSIIVVTDRVVLDRQIDETIKQFTQVQSTVGHAQNSGDLRKFIESGKKIIISTVQKFPIILEDIGNEQRGRAFAIIIDEAHSSQGGKTGAAISGVLSEKGEIQEEESFEDQINRLMQARKLLTNASYFAFTATPKSKTLEIFGTPENQSDGTVRYHPFHNYSMKQAIQEGFILDVLQHYTPVKSFIRLTKTIEDDPDFDKRKANKKLRRYVEHHGHAIRLKAEIMVDHFHSQVYKPKKLGGEARAMVVTNGIEQAIQYYYAITKYLSELKLPYQAIVAFSGDFDHAGNKLTEASMNNFPSNKISEMIRKEPYRFLVCADKFQTGYDEPLLHTMYVDKTLSGIKAVQTLSRLNRSHPQKKDTFVLDFHNDSEVIGLSFADYYQSTILADETDPNKLHDMKSTLDDHQIYSAAQVDELVERYLGDADVSQLHPILDNCVGIYRTSLNEDQQVEFKSAAKAFIRLYGFLSMVLPYPNSEWEKLSIFLNFLVPKLPAPVEEDLSHGILQAIDMDSYRVEKKAVQRISLDEKDAEIDPVSPEGGAGVSEADLSPLSKIIEDFNDRYGNISWRDKDRIERLISRDIPDRVKADNAYQNAVGSGDRQNARIELKKVLNRVVNEFINDDTEFFRRYSDDEDFKKWMEDNIFDLTFDSDSDRPQP